MQYRVEVFDTALTETVSQSIGIELLHMLRAQVGKFISAKFRNYMIVYQSIVSNYRRRSQSVSADIFHVVLYEVLQSYIGIIDVYSLIGLTELFNKPAISCFFVRVRFAPALSVWQRYLSNPFLSPLVIKNCA